MMNDRILEAFLKKQQEEGMLLARQSDILELNALDGPIPQHYVATLHCTGLVQARDGGIVESNQFLVGYYFSSDHLRTVNPSQAVVLFEPVRTWHPNIRSPFMCLGDIAPATSLVDLIYRSFELITYAKCTMREDNALNHQACVWARHNQARFPLDRRPLKRRPVAIAANARASHARE